jgi:nucleotide-binding universal stress UspA family protein
VFKHILIPTDGSPLAAKGAKAGIKLARALGAKVTGVYVVPPYSPMVYGEVVAYVGLPPAEYKKSSERTARKALAAVEIEAQTAAVPFQSHIVTDVQPWQGIVRTARARKCDAIAMASHGRAALGGLILGSETQRVLAHSKIPVLVSR